MSELPEKSGIKTNFGQSLRHRERTGQGGTTVEEFMDWFQTVDEWKVRAVFQHVADSLRASAPTGDAENHD